MVRGVVTTERRFLPEASSVGAARAFVTAAVSNDRRVADCAALLVSELASNAILHARTAFSVRVFCEDDLLRVEVSDREPTLPRRMAYAQHAVTGRGIAIVEELSDRWGAEANVDGKVVFFELYRPLRNGR